MTYCDFDSRGSKKEQKGETKKFQSAEINFNKEQINGRVIDPAIKYLNKDSAMSNRMPYFRESEKWPDQ